jgi:hypothetical protein
MFPHPGQAELASLIESLQRVMLPLLSCNIFPGVDGGPCDSEIHEKYKRIGRSCLEMFVYSCLYAEHATSMECSEKPKSMPEHCDTVLSLTNRSHGFDILFGAWIALHRPETDHPLSISSKACILEAIVGCTAERVGLEISADIKNAISGIARVLCMTESQSNSSTDRLIEYLYSKSIFIGPDLFRTEMVEQFFICYFQNESTPTIGCVVGDCCSTQGEAEEDVAERVLAKISELGEERLGKRARPDAVGTIVPEQGGQGSKQTLLNFLQKNGLKEALGKILTAVPDNIDGKNGFYSQFTFPDSLKSSSLCDIGTIRGPTCSSKKNAENTLCNIVLKSLLS